MKNSSSPLTLILKPYPAEWKTLQDDKTGQELIQLTSSIEANEAVYFECCAFDRSEDYLLFKSKRSGIWEIFRADLRNGELLQLTENADLQGFSLQVHPDGEWLYFITKNALWRVYIKNPAWKKFWKIRFRANCTLPRSVSPQMAYG